MPIEQRICEKIGISEELIVAYSHNQQSGLQENLTFKRDVNLDSQ